MTVQTTTELTSLLDQVNQIMERQKRHRISQHNRVVSRIGSLMRVRPTTLTNNPKSPLALEGDTAPPLTMPLESMETKMLGSLYKVLSATAQLGHLDDALDEVVSEVIQRTDDTRIKMVEMDHRLQTLSTLAQKQKLALDRAADLARSLELARINAVTHADMLRNRLISRTCEVRELERQIQQVRDQLILAQNAQIAVFENGWSESGA